jgi:hypothetical protein
MLANRASLQALRARSVALMTIWGGSADDQHCHHRTDCGAPGIVLVGRRFLCDCEAACRGAAIAPEAFFTIGQPAPERARNTASTGHEKAVGANIPNVDCIEADRRAVSVAIIRREHGLP